MLAFIVSLASTALTALAGGFGTTLGQRAANGLASIFASAGEPQLLSQLKANPTPQVQMRGQRALCSAMSASPQVRATVEATLENARPGTVAEARETAQRFGSQSPELVQRVANGEEHYSKFLEAFARLNNWSDAQAHYYQTHRCPIGHEDLGSHLFTDPALRKLFPDQGLRHGAVSYRDANGAEASIFSSALLGAAFPITAKCENNHEWRVDRPKT